MYNKMYNSDSDKERPVDRILVIDDDVELCSLVAEYLEPEGFQVEAVYNGEQGLEKALAGNHRLVVLDVMLPGHQWIRSPEAAAPDVQNSRIAAHRPRRRCRPHCRSGNRRRRLSSQAV